MSPNKDIRNEEIDLLELFRRLGKAIASAFRAIVKALAICFVFVLRRWLPLTISFFLAIGFSFIMKKSFTSYFSSNMTIRSNTITNADMISYLGKLHTFCLERNIPSLSAALSISTDQAQKIKDIEAFWVIDKNKDRTPDFIDYKNKFNVYDTIDSRMNDRLVVRARYSSVQDLEVLRKGIFVFVNSNSLFKQENDLRLFQINEMLARLNNDIDKLDSLQKIKYFEETKNRLPEKNGQMVFLQEQKTQLIYEDIHKLFKSRQLLDEEKNLYPDIITLLSDFTIPVRPYTGMIFYAKKVVPVFLGFTLILLILLANRKKLKDFFKKY